MVLLEIFESFVVLFVKVVFGVVIICKWFYVSVLGKCFVVVKDYRFCMVGELVFKMGDEVEGNVLLSCCVIIIFYDFFIVFGMGWYKSGLVR